MEFQILIYYTLWTLRVHRRTNAQKHFEQYEPRIQELQIQFLIVYLDDILIYRNSWKNMSNLWSLFFIDFENTTFSKSSLPRIFFKLENLLWTWIGRYPLKFLKHRSVSRNYNHSLDSSITTDCSSEIAQKIVNPLTEITMNGPFDCSTQADNSFSELKRTIKSAILIAQFDPTNTIFGTSNAFKVCYWRCDGTRPWRL